MQAHQEEDLETRENLLDEYPIYYCQDCFPFSEDTPVSDQFNNFWNWISTKHYVIDLTSYTIRSFEFLLEAERDYNKKLHSNYILQSIIYQQEPISLDILQRYLLDLTEETNNWKFPLELEVREPVQTVRENSLFDTTSEEETASITSTHSIIPMAANNMDQNADAILASLQAIQQSLGRRNIATLPQFKGNLQDPVTWLEDFGRAADANQFDADYKFQIVGGFLQGSAATWFSEVTAAHAHNQIIRWSPTGANEATSFTTQFIQRFRTHTLLTRWRHELQNKVQGLTETVDEYAKSIKRLIKQVEVDGARSESAKIHEFTKGLRRDIASTVNNLIGLRDDETLSQAIEVARRIESNLQTSDTAKSQVHFILSSPAFTIQVKETHDELIERLTSNIAKILEPLVQSLNRRPYQPPQQRESNKYNERSRYNDS